MMRAARVENGVVTHIWEVPALDAFADETLLACSGDVVVGATWDGARVTNPPEPAEVVRGRALRQIDGTLSSTLEAGVVHAGIRWHCDPVFQQQLTAFVLAFSAGLLAADATVTIRATDNSLHDLGESQVRALAGAVMLHVQTAYEDAWAAKDAL